MIDLNKGAVTLARPWRIPVRVHSSLVFLPLLFTRGRFAPVAWVAFTGVILLHELGHALMVRLTRKRVRFVLLSGFGGLCAWEGESTLKQRVLIAWGGVLAQLAIFASTCIVIAFIGWPRSSIGTQLVEAFVWMNLANIALNLVPIAPLDGATAWKVFDVFRERRRVSERRAARQRRKFLGDYERAAPPAPEDGDQVSLPPELEEQLAGIAEKSRKRAGR